jgi:hypothetical protein
MLVFAEPQESGSGPSVHLGRRSDMSALGGYPRASNAITLTSISRPRIVYNRIDKGLIVQPGVRADQGNSSCRSRKLE